MRKVLDLEGDLERVQVLAVLHARAIIYSMYGVIVVYMTNTRRRLLTHTADDAHI